MKAMRKILCPTDFSPCSQAGLENAALLAKGTGATLLIVHVQKAADVNTFREREHAQMLNAVVPDDPELPYQHLLASGDPAAEISRLALTEGIDLIVMGTHGRSRVMRMVLGSVARDVLRQAPCPVASYGPSVRTHGPSVRTPLASR